MDDLLIFCLVDNILYVLNENSFKAVILQELKHNFNV